MVEPLSNDNAEKTASVTGSPALLGKFAGPLLLAAALCAVAATVAFGSVGRRQPAGWILAVLGLCCLVGWFVGRKGSATAPSDGYSRQRALLGVNAVASVFLLLGVLFGLNYIGLRHHKTFDLSANKINSLSDQTLRVLDKLPSPVSMTYIYLGRNGRPLDASVMPLLSAYRAASNQVHIEYLDAAVNPLQLQGLGLRSFTGRPLLLLQSSPSRSTSGNDKAPTNAREEISFISEASITSALLRLINPQSRVLYFLNDHGELVPANGGTLTIWGSALAAQNYALRPLSLAGGKATIPQDAAAIIVVAPRVDLSLDEQRKIRKYLQDRGRLVLLLNPPKQLPRWSDLLNTWGLQPLDGFVLDSERSVASSPQVILGVRGEVAGDAARHPLLRGVEANTVFPGVLPLKANAPSPRFSTLFASSSSSVAAPATGHAPARPGPFVMAAAIEAGATRIVVAGNALFATDPYIDQFGNKSFALAAVNWTVGDDTLISIPPKPAVTNTLQITDASRRFFTLFSVLGLPLAVLLIGGAVWWKRR